MITQQFLKFIVIGGVSTIINYIVFYALYEFGSINYVISSAAGFIIGVFVGYGFNKRWTFGVKERTKQYVYKYYVVYTISLLLGLGFLKLLVVVLGLVPQIANVLTIGLTTCTNFMGTKFWVFRK